MGAFMLQGVGGWLGRATSLNNLALLALVGAFLLAAVALLLSMLSLARRRLQQEVRDLVLALEELRAGRTRHRVELDAHSPLTMVADAANRLGQELHVRLGEAAEARERLEAMSDAVGESAIVTTDVDGDIRSFNEGAVRLFGWEVEEVHSKPASLLFDEGGYEALLPRLVRRSLRERGVQARTRLRRKDGTAFPAELTVRTLHRPSGEPIGFLLVIRDVTLEARTENDLREAEARYRRLVEGLTEGVVICREGRIVYGNPALGKLCGMALERLMGQPLRDRIATQDVLMLEEKLRRVETGTADGESLSTGLLGPDGRPRAEVRIQASAIEHEGAPAVLLLIRDETERRRFEEELRRNEAHLDAVIEAASDGILVIAGEPGEGLVRMTNRAFLDLFGLNEQELLGLSEERLRGGLAGRGGGHAALAALLAAGAAERRTEPVRLGGGAPRELEVSTAPLTDRDGRVIGRVVACRDRTRQREAERVLQRHAEELQLSKVRLERANSRLDRANRELRQRTEELNELNRELRTLDQMKSNLLGNVSHELQTPLVSIRGYSEMILKERLGPLTEEQRKGLTLCLKNIDRLISMIDNLLSLSDPALSKLSLSRFPLREVVDEVSAMMGERMEEKGITLVADLGPEALWVHADRDKALQVFLNLFSNAVKFNRSGGSIEVKARPGPSGFVTVDVADTGVGIPPEALEKIFEPRYRVGEQKGAPEKGSGLGLTIVRDILRLHGCRIDARSRPGEGTRFTFTLPRCNDREIRETGGAPATEPSGPAAGPPTDEPAARPGRTAPRAREPSAPPRPDPERAGRPRFRIIRHRDPR